MGISSVVYVPGRILKLFVWGWEIGLFSALTDNTAFCETVSGEEPVTDSAGAKRGDIEMAADGVE